MKYEKVFPFNLVERGSKIILYGAGKLGKQYWKQITTCQWCEIICVVDENYQSICGFPTEVIAPECISRELEYDYVVIAVMSQDKKAEIYGELLERDIPEDKIVASGNQVYGYDQKKVLHYNSTDIYEKDLHIAFCPMGTLGDYIISLKFYQELLKYVKKAVIDIYATDISFAKCVFENKPYLGVICEGSWDWDKYYDFVIEVGMRINIVFLDEMRVRSLAPELFTKMAYLQKINHAEYGYYPAHSYYTSRLMVDRGKFFGENRYSIYNCEGIFDIKDNIVDLDIKDTAKRDYTKLCLGEKYITFNYGAARYSEGEKQRTKMWPKEYHMKLNQLLKNRYPDIGIVQLGAKDIEKISGADRYIMGEDLEVIKVILKNALCHIDCEGGLVHMATQLKTKCVVLFGPTPSWFFGYEQNINVISDNCKECAYLFPDWTIKCHKYERPECMYSIKPRCVFEKVVEYLDTLAEK